MEKLPNCPVCGSKPFVSHDVIPEGGMGYSAGCPRFCYDEPIHCVPYGNERDRYAQVGFYTKEDAIAWWKARVKRG